MARHARGSWVQRQRGLGPKKMQWLSHVKDSQAPEPLTLHCEDKQTSGRKREIDGGAWRSEKAEEDRGARLEQSRDKEPG